MTELELELEIHDVMSDEMSDHDRSRWLPPSERKIKNNKNNICRRAGRRADPGRMTVSSQRHDVTLLTE